MTIANIVRASRCPTCGAPVGFSCHHAPHITDAVEIVNGHAFHHARIALATPQQTEVQRFAEQLASRLDERANDYEREAASTKSDYPGEIGRHASAKDFRKACDYREIAALVRAAAKECK